MGRKKLNSNEFSIVGEGIVLGLEEALKHTQLDNNKTNKVNSVKKTSKVKKSYYEDFKKEQVTTLIGKLTIPEHPIGSFRYCIFDNTSTAIRLHDVSEILGEIYRKSKHRRISIRIIVQNVDTKKCSIIFQDKGVLNLQPINGMKRCYDWHINNNNFGSILFNNTDKKVRIDICDFGYGTYTRKDMISENENSSYPPHRAHLDFE